MATRQPPSNLITNPHVHAVFDDIRAPRPSEFINDLWRPLAFDPDLIASTRPK